MSCGRKRLELLYLLNATVLLTHQIDAAYWHEWRLFALPGPTSFLVLNLPLVALVLLGFRELGTAPPGRRSSRVALASGLLAAAGGFAAVFHGYHLARGDPGFRSTVSIGLLVATTALSLVQMAELFALQRRASRAERGGLDERRGGDA
jgi:hypothetical protein